MKLTAENPQAMQLYHILETPVPTLRCSRPPDAFIPHFAVDQSAQMKKIKPKAILLSHILELGHEIGKWRWPISLRLKIANKCGPVPVYTHTLLAIALKSRKLKIRFFQIIPKTHKNGLLFDFTPFCI